VDTPAQAGKEKMRHTSELRKELLLSKLEDADEEKKGLNSAPLRALPSLLDVLPDLAPPPEPSAVLPRRGRRGGPS
jgi:hypothetical protein